MQDHQRRQAVLETSSLPSGQPRYICATCGGRLTLRQGGLGCGRDFSHAGLVPVPRPSEAAILARLQRGGALPDLSPRQELRIAYLILRFHAWGQHYLCDWLPVLGLSGAGCERLAPARTEASLW